jgi:hypothetical protein
MYSIYIAKIFPLLPPYLPIAPAPKATAALDVPKARQVAGTAATRARGWASQQVRKQTVSGR